MNRAKTPISYLLPHNSKKNGFTIFFAMLVGSLALAVGFAIYDLTVREIDLSAAATQSQYAIYAADTGVECALYWDAKAPALNGSPSIFATSTGTGNASPSSAGTTCNNQNIITAGTQPSPIVAPPAGWTGWVVAGNGTSATTTFTVSFLQTGQPYCAKVEVGKVLQSNVLYTTVVSRGYNNCNTTGPARLERSLRVSY